MVIDVPITGDFAAVKDFVKKVGKLKDASKLVGTAAAPKLQKLIEAGFSSGGDPYGSAWQPKKDGGAPFAGGAAEGWAKITLADGGKKIRTTLVPPGVFHQKGTKSGRKARRQAGAASRKSGGNKAAQAAARNAVGGAQKLPARPIIPDNDRGIPPAWRAAILEAAKKIMAESGATPK